MPLHEILILIPMTYALAVKRQHNTDRSLDWEYVIWSTENKD